jgi:hypothetical protein
MDQTPSGHDSPHSSPGRATRRGFIGVAGIGAAAGLAVAVAPSAGDAVKPTASAPDEAATLPAGADGSMAAYIHDVHRGEVSILVGDREVVVTDHVLVARLAQAFTRASA